MDPITDYNCRYLYEVMKQAPRALEIVKMASWSELTRTDLPSHCYADPFRQQYPIHSKEAVLLSAAYFWKYRPDADSEETAYIRDNLEKAAALFQCQEELEEIRQAMIKKEAQIPEDAWLINEKGRKALPVTDSASLVKAAAWFCENRDQIRYSYRRQISQKLLEKRAQFHTYLDPEVIRTLQRSAGYGICKKSDAVELVRKYAYYAETPAGRFYKEAQAVKEPLLKVAEDILKRETLTPYELAELCKTLDDLDWKFGLISKRASGWPLPEDILFAATEEDFKEAEYHIIGSPFTGRYYHRADLVGMSASDLRHWLGENIAKMACYEDEYIDFDALKAILKQDREAARRFDLMVQNVLGATPI